MRKICSKCKKKKDLSEFSKDSYQKNGLRCWCRECCKKRREKYYSVPENKAKLVQQVLKSREHHKEQYRELQRKYGLSKFNLTIEDYDCLLNLQNGVCAICGQEESIPNKRLAVDHDHKTGEVRGLLCTSCNTKLGWYEKQKENLEAYLKVAQGWGM